MFGKFAYISYKAECTVSYRYTCEQCGYTTDWNESRLYRIAHVKLKSTRFERNYLADIKDVKRAEKKAAKILKEAIQMINEKMESVSGDIMFPKEPFLADEYNAIFASGKSCSQCKCQQSWYPARSKPPSKWRKLLFSRSDINPKNGGSIARHVPEIQWGEIALDVALPTQ